MVMYPEIYGEANAEPRRIVKAVCDEHGVYCYLNTDDRTHELYHTNTLAALTEKIK